jgi:hypothetical protein
VTAEHFHLLFLTVLANQLKTSNTEEPVEHQMKKAG